MSTVSLKTSREVRSSAPGIRMGLAIDRRRDVPALVSCFPVRSGYEGSCSGAAEWCQGKESALEQMR